MPGRPLHAPTGASAGLIGAAIAVTAWGASGVVAKWLTMGALAIVTYRFGAYAVIIGASRAIRNQPLTKAAFVASIPGGLWLAADVALFFTAIKLTTVVNATMIGSLQPLVLTLYGVRFLGEKVMRRDVALGAVALAGAIVIVLAGSSSGEGNIWGDLAAVGALASWSTYFVIAKDVNARVSPTDFTISTAIIVAVTNAPLALLFGQSLAWPTLPEWGWLLLMALGAGVLGHNLMNWSLPRIALWLGSTFTLFVPVVSSALAWAFLDEPLVAMQIIGMAITVFALAMLVYFQQSDTSRAAAAVDAPEILADSS